MIEEDYVSFETAKLLKEKGFDEPCSHIYRNDGMHLYCGDAKLTTLTNTEIDEPQDWVSETFTCTCPTLQMARKWLREKHHLHIEVRITNHSMSDMVNIIKYYWVMTNTETGRWCDESTVYDIKPFDKSEEAEEDAIRIALKNWI